MANGKTISELDGISFETAAQQGAQIPVAAGGTNAKLNAADIKGGMDSLQTNIDGKQGKLNRTISLTGEVAGSVTDTGGNVSIGTAVQGWKDYSTADVRLSYNSTTSGGTVMRLRRHNKTGLVTTEIVSIQNLQCSINLNNAGSQSYTFYSLIPSGYRPQNLLAGMGGNVSSTATDVINILSPNRFFRAIFFLFKTNGEITIGPVLGGDGYYTISWLYPPTLSWVAA